MFENQSLAARPLADQPQTAGRVYAGPERRSTGAQVACWLAHALDEVDYGLLLLDGDGRVLHANRAARRELDDAHPLQLLGNELRARHARDVAPLHDALAAASQRGLRRLLTVGGSDNGTALAVVPLSPAAGRDDGPTLLMMGKRHVCAQLTVQCFASAHGLTGAEARVLDSLCRGLPPRDIADQNGVGIATVRSQIGAIREKTDAPSIRALLDAVARLPPMGGLMRPSRPAVTMDEWRSRTPLLTS